jgi:hypothetical protein
VQWREDCPSRRHGKKRNSQGDANVITKPKNGMKQFYLHPRPDLSSKLTQFSLDTPSHLSQPYFSTTTLHPTQASSPPSSSSKTSPRPAQNLQRYCSSWQTYSTSALPTTFLLQLNIVHGHLQARGHYTAVLGSASGKIT